MLNQGIVDHYRQYFRMVFADCEELRMQAYRLRYQVYCQEFGFNLVGADHLREIETDEYDSHAKHCLLIHKPSDRVIGNIRLIIADSNSDKERLPIESYCHTIDRDKFDFDAFREKKLGEYSRLAVISQFRRRKIDQHRPYSFFDVTKNETEAQNRITYPVISLSLALAGFAIILYSDLHKGLAIMEPSLVRMLKRYGIFFNKIGDRFERDGQRIPCVLDVRETLARLHDEAWSLLEVIGKELGVFDSERTLPSRY